MADTTSPWANDAPVPFPNWERLKVTAGVTYCLGNAPKNDEQWSDPDGWHYLCYRPAQKVDEQQVPIMLRILAQSLSIDINAIIGGEKTTMIVMPKGSRRERYYTLIGDFRAEYEAALPNGPEAVIAVWAAHPDKQLSHDVRLNEIADKLDAREREHAKSLN